MSPRCHQVAEILNAVSPLLCLQLQPPPPSSPWRCGLTPPSLSSEHRKRLRENNFLQLSNCVGHYPKAGRRFSEQARTPSAPSGVALRRVMWCASSSSWSNRSLVPLERISLLVVAKESFDIAVRRAVSSFTSRSRS